jgi:hypothetical protein
MAKHREIRCSESVNHPYKLVRNALVENAKLVFEHATKGAASNKASISSELHAKIAGMDLAQDVAITVTKVDQRASAPKSGTATCFQLEWAATVLPRLFPVMKADLLVWPLNGTETRLDFVGSYAPPAGPLGTVIDSIAGHRIAQASVDQFIKDVASYLNDSLTRKPNGTVK